MKSSEKLDLLKSSNYNLGTGYHRTIAYGVEQHDFLGALYQIYLKHEFPKLPNKIAWERELPTKTSPFFKFQIPERMLEKCKRWWHLSDEQETNLIIENLESNSPVIFLSIMENILK